MTVKRGITNKMKKKDNREKFYMYIERGGHYNDENDALQKEMG